MNGIAVDWGIFSLVNIQQYTIIRPVYTIIHLRTSSLNSLEHLLERIDMSIKV